MTTPIVECVPNISEGRDAEVISKIVDAARISGVTVLGCEPDSDYHRTVITFAGSPEKVAEAAFELTRTALELIDMRNHQGEHPRMGAVDVIPFIPIQECDLEECAQLARRLAERLHTELGLPTYLYGTASSSQGRENLSALRKGEVEGLKDRFDGSSNLHDEETARPDFGPVGWDQSIEKTGATAIGARKILIAYNVNLDEKEPIVARKVGSIVRASGRLIRSESGASRRIPGMLTSVKGMGVALESHQISQVSMNLDDHTVTPMHLAFLAVSSLAQDHGVQTKGSELVGLVPLAAILEAGKWFCKAGAQDERDIVNAAIEGLGLSEISPFIPKERIIEYAMGLKS